MKLHHGSSIAIEHPDVSYNKGFSDLGKGFYLTDDYEVACARARSRSRIDGIACGVVTSFAFDDASVDWAVWGDRLIVSRPSASKPSASAGATEVSADMFGLRFEANRAGIAAWADNIKACRRGSADLAGLGDPAVVAAWIATEEVEMVCSGFASAADLAEFVDPADLVVQYCFRDQRLIDRRLTCVSSAQVAAH